MFLHLNHQKLQVYVASKEFVLECYRLSKKLPTEEKFVMMSQIRRAALSAHLNIAEGSSRKSITERRRYYEVARGSVVEIDAALDIAEGLEYFKNVDLKIFGEKMIYFFKLLWGLLK